MYMFLSFYEGSGEYPDGTPAIGIIPVIEQLRAGGVKATDWTIHLTPSSLRSIKFNETFAIDDDETVAFMKNDTLMYYYVKLLHEISFQLRSRIRNIDVIPSKLDIIRIYRSVAWFKTFAKDGSELHEITDRLEKQLVMSACEYMTEAVLARNV